MNCPADRDRREPLAVDECVRAGICRCGYVHGLHLQPDGIIVLQKFVDEILLTLSGHFRRFRRSDRPIRIIDGAFFYFEQS